MIGSAETTVYLLAATVFLVVTLVYGYKRSRDPLHPVVFLAPLFFLGLVLDPARQLLHPEIVEFFPGYKGLGFALLVQYLGMVTFFAGVLATRPLSLPARRGQLLFDWSLTVSQRRQLRGLAGVIGAVAVIAFWIGIWQVGGFFQAYSRSKGGGQALSGYLGEAMNLGFAALIIHALGCQTRRLRATDLALGIIMVSPLLITGTFGGRRGPLFLSLAALFTAYWIAKGRLPRPAVIATAFICFVVALVFVKSQRGHLYLGSEKGIQWSEFTETIAGEELGPGDNFVASSGAVIAMSQTRDFHYGRRFLMTYLVRPIPRQLWRSKYDDAASWLYGKGTTYRTVTSQHYRWANVLGWRPPNGFAQNTIVDLFMEFGWFFWIPTFVLGRLIGFCWYKFRTRGGIWLVLFVTVAALSIYLPTQSFRAFAYRFLYMSVMTAAFWKLFLGRLETHRPRRVAAARRGRLAMPQAR